MVLPVLIGIGEAVTPLIARFGINQAGALIGKGILGGIGMAGGGYAMKQYLKEKPRRRVKRHHSEKKHRSRRHGKR